MQQTISSPFWHPARAEAFILDWDGVLADTRLDFGPLREKYFGGKRVPLIEASDLLPEPARGEAKSEIRRVEMEGAERAVPVEGAKDLIAWLEGAGKPWSVVSRNCRDSILSAARRCGITLPPVLLSREDPHVKPAPEALALAAGKMRVNLAGCVMVGDFIYDLLGARRASVRAVLVQRDGAEWGHLADASWPTVRAFVESLSHPSPLVPWEYHDLVKERGTDYLEAVARNVYRLDASDGAFQRVLDLAGLGALRFSVPGDAKLGIDDWKKSFLPAQAIDMPLSVLLQDAMAARWPCVRLVVPEPSDRVVEVPPLRGSELEKFLLASLPPR
ncbi:MAG: HAD hydrolase-like protein [Synergistaceae bacterium]|jgi:phosphoglycolate phosphatase-like HAD superfamily hydrolase|nr:HAD hydrolase-like protein [Synergistaceae bacterium]